jgi:hypothetical protein
VTEGDLPVRIIWVLAGTAGVFGFLMMALGVFRMVESPKPAQRQLQDFVH